MLGTWYPRGEWQPAPTPAAVRLLLTSLPRCPRMSACWADPADQPLTTASYPWFPLSPYFPPSPQFFSVPILSSQISLCCSLGKLRLPDGTSFQLSSFLKCMHAHSPSFLSQCRRGKMPFLGPVNSTALWHSAEPWWYSGAQSTAPQGRAGPSAAGKCHLCPDPHPWFPPDLQHTQASASLQNPFKSGTIIPWTQLLGPWTLDLRCVSSLSIYSFSHI